MRIDDFQKFHDGIAGVMSFYGKSVSGFALDVWWTALKVYDLAAIVDAFNRHLANPDAGQFAPKPADIIRILQGSSQDAALRAWAKVDLAVRRVGTYCDVVFDDALIHRVIQDMGGWIALGTKAENEWPFVAKEFENRYRGFCSRGELPQYPATLIGLATAHNSRKGFRSGTPVLIGQEQLARQIWRGGTDQPVLGLKRMSDNLDGIVDGAREEQTARKTLRVKRE
ncbi:DUF6475 domain-containing protein [Nitrosovibrio tenuis]|uniref:DUF6475 domain-containing protein n=1 Tax=Nitrosovibrio tenuis TaxID=1233 RepID=A0A1H7IG22_9PROT|nr:DUF6475 domain-containing protein [Nitrosovibrio tenuis]SEK61461.1 hypothetical protein SAMN05216387_102162 [Nitrosovibrio tenuis]